MIRKTLTTLSVMALCVLCSMSVMADWYKYPVYCDAIDDVVETSSKVFYLSGGNLYSFCPTDNEIFAYTELNKLNDKDITSLYYNPEKKYLVVVYANSNIDVITDDGNVINLPEIKDASVSASKTINDVTFGEDRIAIATDFGIVIYRDDRFEVVESGIFNKPMTTALIIDGKLLIYGEKDTDYSILMAPLETRHNNLDKFTKLVGIAAKQMRVIDKDLVAIRDYNDNLLLRRIDFGSSSWNDILKEKYTYHYPIKVYKDGYFTLTEDKIVTIVGDKVETSSIPSDIRGEVIGFYEDPTKIWCGNEKGVAAYDISSSTPTLLFDRMIYSDFITTQRVGYMKWSPDNKRLYISNMENSVYRNYAKGEGSTNYQTTNIIEDGKTIDASLKNATATHKYPVLFQEEFGNKRMYGDPTDILQDPDDPNRYYCGNYFEGLYVLQYNEQTKEYDEIGLFTSQNSTIQDNWGQRVMWVNIDRQGNLWVGYQFGNLLSMLPAAKRLQDPKTITKNDWKTYSNLEGLEYSSKDFMGVICRQSNMIFFSMSLYDKGFIAIDTKGTYDDLSDDTIYQWTKVTDQDGNEVSYNYITYFLEDNRGCVWVGTNAGVFEITNPSEATDFNMRVRRIKVPRNDGTNYADYLLDSDMINWIALDPADRKWIATQSSGLFLVSETGDKIITQYTSENSPLPSNLVCTVECDKTDNTVYVGTTNGLYTFKSDASPGKEDYSEIYAYPNPVRPEYSGMVNITGLMDSSVVKITDASGSVVYETRSEGGMATWDVCNNSGNRVKSGVYYVYASQNNSGTTSGAVTKILVIN